MKFRYEISLPPERVVSYDSTQLLFMKHADNLVTVVMLKEDRSCSQKSTSTLDESSNFPYAIKFFVIANAAGTMCSIGVF